ncbi:MAG TPA: flavin reductase family protein [Longilinea sp.]|nr:flavin reductase family protein [Longilinea sp.]
MDNNYDLPESLRRAMRHWTAGVTIVTSYEPGERNGMTVNSFASISLDPPVVAVTLANSTRTYALVDHTRQFGVTILGEKEKELSDRFAGRMANITDRLEGLETFEMVSGVPLIKAGLAHLDCKVIFKYPLPNSTLFLGSVLAADWQEDGQPLVYFNRDYHRLSS